MHGFYLNGVLYSLVILSSSPIVHVGKYTTEVWINKGSIQYFVAFVCDAWWILVCSSPNKKLSKNNKTPTTKKQDQIQDLPNTVSAEKESLHEVKE